MLINYSYPFGNPKKRSAYGRILCPNNVEFNI